MFIHTSHSMYILELRPGLKYQPSRWKTWSLGRVTLTSVGPCSLCLKMTSVIVLASELSQEVHEIMCLTQGASAAHSMLACSRCLGYLCAWKRRKARAVVNTVPSLEFTFSLPQSRRLVLPVSFCLFLVDLWCHCTSLTSLSRGPVLLVKCSVLPLPLTLTLIFFLAGDVFFNCLAGKAKGDFVS